MSITFDPDKWSHPSRAWDIERVFSRQRSPRLVLIGDLPYFKARADIHGDALFRQFTGEDEPTIRIIKKHEKGTRSED